MVTYALAQFAIAKGSLLYLAGLKMVCPELDDSVENDPGTGLGC